MWDGTVEPVLAGTNSPGASGDWQPCPVRCPVEVLLYMFHVKIWPPKRKNKRFLDKSCKA